MIRDDFQHSDQLSSTNTSGKAISRVLKQFGNSIFGWMKGITEKVTLKDKPNAKLGGHFLEDPKELLDIKKEQDGYIRKNEEL